VRALLHRLEGHQGRGLSGSGGDFADTHFSANVDDLVVAADGLHGVPA